MRQYITYTTITPCGLTRKRLHGKLWTGGVYTWHRVILWKTLFPDCGTNISANNANGCERQREEERNKKKKLFINRLQGLDARTCVRPAPPPPPQPLPPPLRKVYPMTEFGFSVFFSVVGRPGQPYVLRRWGGTVSVDSTCGFQRRNPKKNFNFSEHWLRLRLGFKRNEGYHSSIDSTVKEIDKTSLM